MDAYTEREIILDAYDHYVDGRTLKSCPFKEEKDPKKFKIWTEAFLDVKNTPKEEKIPTKKEEPPPITKLSDY